MKQCPNCRQQIPDEACFCTVCGTAIDAFHSFPEPYPPQEPFHSVPAYDFPVPDANPLDHTEDFSEEDISSNKLLCMIVYLFDLFGILIALIAAKDSPYTGFHIRQSMKYSVLEALLCIGSAVLVWTVVAPVLGLVGLIVLMVLKFICFVQVCKGKAIETGLLQKIKFLN